MLVSYDMNRLQRLAEPDDYVVTLNGAGRVDPDRVLARMRYEHPIYTPESVAAQRRLPELNDGTLAFAGAYHGWGFHEDGCAAGVRAAASLGVDVVSAQPCSTTAAQRAPRSTTRRCGTPAARRSARTFAHRIYYWLVDLDGLPTLPRWLRPFAGFDARDHLGDPGRSIRQNLDAYLATQGVDLHGGRVLMLANARVLGYVFNPLTVYWCHRPDGTARVRGGRGAQHLRRAALLPAAPRRRRPRRDGQGLLRLARSSPWPATTGWCSRCPTTGCGSRSRCASRATPRWWPPWSGPADRPPRPRWPGCCCDTRWSRSAPPP